jgi:hypothetical protein
MQELPSLEELIITVDECVNLVDIGDVVSIVGILGKISRDKSLFFCNYNIWYIR